MGRKTLWSSSVLAACVLSVAGSTLAQERVPLRPRSRMNSAYSDPSLQMQYFYKPRQYPYSATPLGAQQQAWAQAERKFVAERAADGGADASQTDSFATANTWVEIGPHPLNSGKSTGEVSGRVSALAIDPRNHDWVYLGAADGGVWKSLDAGSNWTPLTDAMPSLAIGAIAIAPSAPDTVYVGLGEGYAGYDFYYGMGILKTTDGGATWMQITGPFYGPLGRTSYGAGAHMGALAVKPSDADILLAGVKMPGITSSNDQSGIWRSPDGGANWSLVLAGAPATQIVFDPANADIVYAGIGFASEAAWGVYKSTDAGASWTKINGVSGKLPTTNMGRIALAVQHTSGKSAVLYAGVAEDKDRGQGTLRGLFKASDNGTSAIDWTQLTGTPNYCSGSTPQCWYANALAVLPGDSNVVYAGGSGNVSLYRTLDGGLTWTSVAAGSDGQAVHTAQHALNFSNDGAVLYIGNDGGAWKTTTTRTSPVAYSNLNHTLGTLQFYPGVSVHPSNVKLGLGSAQGNGLAKYSGNLAWESVYGCDSGWTAIHPTTPSLMYVVCQRVSPLKSTDGGANWSPGWPGLNTSDSALTIAPMAMDYRTPENLYLGTTRVWRTLDGAANWTAISGDLSRSAGASVISALAVAPGDSNVVYAGTLDGNVQVTSVALAAPTGVTWSVRASGLPNRSVTNFAISAMDANTAYVTFSGFSWGTDTLGHVFKTTDGGLTWSDISGAGRTGLPNSPGNAIVIDPDVPGNLYVALDVGVYRSADDGSTWTTLGSGLPKAAVTDLKLHQASRTLRAATHGRGMWDLSVPLVTGAFVSPASVDFGVEPIGESSEEKTITLKNDSGVDLTSVRVNITGDFALRAGAGNCGTALKNAQSCSLTVNFTPQSVGAEAAALTVSYNGGNPLNVNLYGTGVAMPVLDSSTSALIFPMMPVGVDSSPQTVTITNSGILPLNLERIDLTGDFRFALPPACSTIAPTANCGISIIFKPQAAGTRTGLLSITDDAFGSPHQITLTGAGTIDHGEFEQRHLPPTSRRSAERQP